MLTGAAALTVKLGGILVLPGGTAGRAGARPRFRAAVPAHLYCNDGHDDGREFHHHPAVLQNLLGDEGYLMFTLPVTPAQHITASWPWAQCGRLSLALAVLAAAALIFSFPARRKTAA
ncbi:MAG: hypothetical protein ACLRZH_18890 [Ruthenibacterium lactatiformans]